MGQAARKKQFHRDALLHLKQFGKAAGMEDAYQQASGAWLQQYFVSGLRTATSTLRGAWHNQVYLEAQQHEDPDVRRGIRTLMNDVMAGGLEVGRVVFALLADAELARPEVVGEFDHCKPLAAWVAEQLKVPRVNVRVRYSGMFVPSRGGLFGLMPTLELITDTKKVGEQPKVASRKGSRPAQQRPRLTFLVSVYTSGSLDVDALTPASTAPTFQLPYWGPEDITPDQVASVTPVRAMHVFESLEMLGFWENMQELETALAPLRAQAEAASPGGTPVLQVTLRSSGGPQMSGGVEVFARWRDVEMDEVLAYQGGFANNFIVQLERLNVVIDRTPGILPALPDGPLFMPDGELADNKAPANDWPQDSPEASC